MQQRLLKYNPRSYRNLKLDALPVLHLPGTTPKMKDSKRLERMNRKMQRKVVDEILQETISPENQASTSYEREETMEVEVTQTIPSTATSENVTNDNE